MSTAVYYSNNIPMEDHSHSLPSLSQIIPIGQDLNSLMVNMPVREQRLYSQMQHSPDVFSQKDVSQTSSTNTTPVANENPVIVNVNGMDAANGISSTNVNTDKCTCKSNANRIPRPRNAFILFRQKNHQLVLEEGSVIRTNPDVSRELGKRWRSLSREEKEHWNKLAEEEKIAHAKKYPGYKYTPRRNGKNKGCPACRQKALRQHQAQQMQYQKKSYYQLQLFAPNSAAMMQHFAQGPSMQQAIPPNGVPQILVNRFAPQAPQDMNTQQIYQQPIQQQIPQMPVLQPQSQQERLSPLSAGPQMNFANLYLPELFPVTGTQVITLENPNQNNTINPQMPINFEFGNLH